MIGYFRLYFSTEYHNSRQNTIILFWKYLVDIRIEAWLNLLWEHINGNLFAVYLFMMMFFLFSVYPSFVFIERLRISHIQCTIYVEEEYVDDLCR